MRPARVLVTGAAGFIGQHLVRAQLERGRQVRALDRDAAALGRLGPRDGLEVVAGDVAEADVQRAAVADIDLVFHLASAHLETGLPEAAYHRINVDAVKTLLTASREAGVRRFVHVSSSSVHGSVTPGPADEEAPFCPTIPYEQTKASGELAARDFARRSGFPVVVARPVWVYGPGCKRTARLFQTVASRKFVMVGRGANFRSAIYITDLLDALERCATRPGIEGEAFLVTHDEMITVSAIVSEIARLVGSPGPRLRVPLVVGWNLALAAEMAARMLGKDPPFSRRSLKFFTTDAAFTCAKARRQLGFEPRIPLRRGLELTYRWWRSNGGGG